MNDAVARTTSYLTGEELTRNHETKKNAVTEEVCHTQVSIKKNIVNYVEMLPRFGVSLR